MIISFLLFLYTINMLYFTYSGKNYVKAWEMKSYQNNIGTRKIVLSLSIIAIIALSNYAFHATQTFYKIFNRGERHYLKGEYTESLPFFVEAFNMQPDDLRTGTYLLWNYERLGMRKKATHVLEVMAKHNPDDLMLKEQLADFYYHLLDYKKAEGVYRFILKEDDTFNIRRKLAEVLVWQKEYPQAITILEDLIKKDPRNLELTELLADVYSWSGEFNESIKLYKKLLAKNYHEEDIVLKLAETLRFAGRDDEAIKLYNEYLKNNKE